MGFFGCSGDASAVSGAALGVGTAFFDAGKETTAAEFVEFVLGIGIAAFDLAGALFAAAACEVWLVSAGCDTSFRKGVLFDLVVVTAADFGPATGLEAKIPV